MIAPQLAESGHPTEASRPPSRSSLPGMRLPSSPGINGYTFGSVLVKGLTRLPFLLPFCSGPGTRDGRPSGETHRYYHASLLFDELELAACASLGTGNGGGFFSRQHMARFFLEHCSHGLARFRVGPLLGNETDMALTGAACVAVVMHRLASLSQMATSQSLLLPPALQEAERSMACHWARAFCSQLCSASQEEVRELLASAAPSHYPSRYCPQSEDRYERIAKELLEKSTPIMGASLPLVRQHAVPSLHPNDRSWSQWEVGLGREQATAALPMRPPQTARPENTLAAQAAARPPDRATEPPAALQSRRRKRSDSLTSSSDSPAAQVATQSILPSASQSILPAPAAALAIHHPPTAVPGALLRGLVPAGVVASSTAPAAAAISPRVVITLISPDSSPDLAPMDATSPPLPQVLSDVPAAAPAAAAVPVAAEDTSHIRASSTADPCAIGAPPASELATSRATVAAAGFATSSLAVLPTGALPSAERPASVPPRAKPAPRQKARTPYPNESDACAQGLPWHVLLFECFLLEAFFSFHQTSRFHPCQIGARTCSLLTDLLSGSAAGTKSAATSRRMLRQRRARGGSTNTTNVTR
jgi:hypothetical protein